MPDFQQEFGYDGKSKIAKSNLSANLVSVMQAGAVVGALVAFPCADKWGRKPSLIGVSIFAFIGGLLQAFSYGHLSCFYIGR
jgi:MFS family permease